MRSTPQTVGITVGIGLIAIGTALVMLVGPIDGFVGGMGQGAGVTLILLGVMAVGSRLWWRRDEQDGSWWLPSRDRR